MLLKMLGLEQRERVNPVHPQDPGLARLFGFGTMSGAGVSVTPETAQSSVTVMACVRVLAETAGQLPLILYQRGANGTRSRAEKHKLFRILRRRPNAFQTSIEFKTMMQGHLALRGNAYAEIVATRRAPVEELIPLHPDRVRPFWVKRGVRAYEYNDPDQGRRVILQDEMFHLMGPPRADGLMGMSPIEVHRNAIGLDLAQEEQAGRLLANSVSVPGVLKTAKALGEDGLKNLRKSIDTFHKGADKAGRYMILEQGLEWQQIGLSMADAQFLEQRKFSRTQICAIFNVPPHMVGDLERATFSNIEHQTLGFVKFTMMPWTIRWEEAITRDLLPENEQEQYFAEFLYDALLRGDLESRISSYVKGIQWGWLSVNDVRRMENMDPIEGGDVYLQPSNMVPVAGDDAEKVMKMLKEMLNDGKAKQQPGE